MTTVFDDYLNKHLSSVDKARDDFLRLHPSLENVMGRDAISPEVDILNKSLAYLAAKIEQRIDQSYPEVILKIFDLLAPEFIRPQPSATILNFIPKERVMLSAAIIEKGVQTFSSQEGRNIIFATADTVKIPPIKIINSVTEKKHHRTKVRLDYNTLEGAVFSFADVNMRYFINKQLNEAYNLYYHLFNKIISVNYVVNGEKFSAKIEDYGLDTFNLKYLDKICSRTNLFQEFVSFPERFLFFEINADNKNIKIDSDFSVEFIFDDRNNEIADVDLETFLLGCVVGVNIEKATAVPIKRIPEKSKYPVYIDSYDEDYCVCDIKQVRSFIVADGVKKNL
ncbi:type VI secretion system baseplate subunit TssF [Piscirickettsia litoralis]|uniref:type VI secretion system baseplate subunit TssF n=1 Tax=Piscirickettsia litoralis TaxID=1891921 RepID=UPI000AA367C0|nr:type VI secretion system baseplate subunit TssF [Piscirickettsia litoralis]